MKTQLFAALLMAIAGCLTSTAMTIRFHVANATGGRVAVVCNMKVDELRLDSVGTAEWSLDCTGAVYAKIYYGANMRHVYLESDDTVSVSFDADDFDGTLSITGGKEKATKYLNRTQLVSLHDDDFALPFNEYADKVERKIAAMTRLLRAYGLDGEGSFAQTEAGRIKYFYACSLLMYPVSHAFVSQDTAYRPDSAYYATLRRYAVEDESLATVPSYQSFMAEAAHALDEANRDERDYYRKTVAAMSYIGENYKSRLLAANLIHHLAFTYVEGNGTKGTEDLRNVFYAYVSDPRLVSDFEEACEKWNLAAKGKPSPDFHAVDADGNSYSLANFRGKYVFIDLWATWCGPCQREMPYLKKLQASYEGKNIVFVSLSIDSDKAKWERWAKGEGATGVQLHIGQGSKFQRDYGIGGIPHFILIGPDGRIIDNNMTRPSQEETARVLDRITKS